MTLPAILEGLELVGANGCPYVQRVVAYLIEKHIPFKYQNVDLQNKPEWFLKRSPLGKVPLIRLKDGQEIFESAIINEFLDSVLPQDQQLAPADPLLRAQNKAWLEFIGAIFVDAYGAIGKATKAEYETSLEAVSKKFEFLNAQIKGPFFNGEKISLIDLAAAPLLQRLTVFDKTFKSDFGEKKKHAKVTQWVETLTKYPALNQAAALQYEDPAIPNPEHDVKSISSHHVDFAKVVQNLEERQSKSLKTRFPNSYIASTL